MPSIDNPPASYGLTLELRAMEAELLAAALIEYLDRLGPDALLRPATLRILNKIQNMYRSEDGMAGDSRPMPVREE